MAQIDDIDMGDPDNVLYFEANSDTVDHLAWFFDRAKRHHGAVRVTIDHGALKVKMDDESWSPPMRSDRPHGGYHKNGGQG